MTLSLSSASMLKRVPTSNSRDLSAQFTIHLKCWRECCRGSRTGFMLKLKYIRAFLFAVAFTGLTLPSGASSQRPHAATDHQSSDKQSFSVVAGSVLPEAPVNSGDNKLIPSSPRPVSSNSTFFTIRRDLRRCAAPICGGYYVRPVNHLLVFQADDWIHGVYIGATMASRR